MTATVEQPGPLAAVDQEQIRIRGARVHNLRNLDLDILVPGLSLMIVFIVKRSS